MQQAVIRENFTKADLDLIIERHRTLYEKEFGFDTTFGDYVAETLKAKIEHIWIAEIGGEFAGCIGVVESDSETAQLRWLLLEPSARGKGIGKSLMDELLEYCNRKGYTRIFLWTVNTLPAARAVYERYGFRLSEQKPEMLLWGQDLIEERWDLSLKRNG